MNLPEIPYKSANKKSYQTKFGGYNHTLGASDGEIYDMQNMASDNYPVLSPRHQRYLLRSLTKPHGIFNHGNKMMWVDGTTFYYDGVAYGTVADSDKQFAAINNRIIIFPDKKYFNTDTLKSKGTYETLAALESSVPTPNINDIYLVGSTAPYRLYYWNGDEWVQNKYTFGDLESTFTGAVSFLGEGELFDTSAEANTIYSNGIEWSDYFEEGDAITITGCTEHTENNKTPIIREIDKNLLRFYENTFIYDNKLEYTNNTGNTLKSFNADDDYAYVFESSLDVSHIMSSGYYYCFNEIKQGHSYKFIPDTTSYYFTNPYDSVSFFRWNSSTSQVILYHGGAISTISATTTSISGAEEVTVTEGDNTSNLPISFYLNGTWYSFYAEYDLYAGLSFRYYPNGSEFSGNTLMVYDGIVLYWETSTVTEERIGLNLNNVSSRSMLNGKNYYFNTKESRIVFSLVNQLLEDEKVIYKDSVLTQENMGSIAYEKYENLDMTYIGSEEYKSTISTFPEGGYYFYAGENSVYFYVTSGGSYSIPITNEGYFIYDGTVLRYYYGESSSVEMLIYDAVIDEFLTFAEVPIDYTESSVTLKRTLPDMDYLCSDRNRLWGCKDDTIYASKLGDPFNFNVFDGLSTDSWSVNVGTAGKFTGCISYLGYPTFFKEDMIYKVYGSTPRNYEGVPTMTLGLSSNGSLAIAGETLFYMNKEGIVAYTGGIPRLISESLGARYTGGAAGSDGIKYYISMKDTSGAYSLFVYDTLSMLWHREDNLQALSFCYTDQLNVLTSDGKIKTVSPCSKPTGSTEEGNVPWMVQFADFYADSPNKKGVSKVHLRLHLEQSANATAYIKYNGDTNWTTIKEMRGTYKQSYYLPIRPRRGDSFSIKLEGAGKCDIYSLSLEYYMGSQL